MNMRDSGVPWLGNVPPHWRVLKVGLAGSILMGRQRAPQHEKGDHMTPYLRVANVLDGFIDYSDILEMNFEPDEQSLFAVSPGDILLNEGQSRELVGRSAIYRGKPNQFCFQNTLIRFRAGDGLDPEFAQAQFGSWLNVGVFQLFCRQSTNIAHLGADRLAEIRMAVPPLAEQRSIVAHLSRETSRLDALVAAKQRVLGLLTEKRKAIIATAVTRGLDPKVKLRDSGVPWLGEIPEHWESKRMKYLFRLVADKAPVENDFELLSLYTDIGVKPRRELEERGNKASSTDEYWLVQPGDLVVNKLLAWMGAFGVSEYCGVTSPAYDILRPHEGVESFFYHHLFRCGVATTEVRARSYGIMDMRLRLYFDRLGDMYVPVPPHDEQRAIVEHIARETAKIDAVRAATERTVALLKERRAALIAAAVTGQLDVGTAA